MPIYWFDLICIELFVTGCFLSSSQQKKKFENVKLIWKSYTNSLRDWCFTHYSLFMPHFSRHVCLSFLYPIIQRITIKFNLLRILDWPDIYFYIREPFSVVKTTIPQIGTCSWMSILMLGLPIRFRSKLSRFSFIFAVFNILYRKVVRVFQEQDQRISESYFTRQNLGRSSEQFQPKFPFLLGHSLNLVCIFIFIKGYFILFCYLSELSAGATITRTSSLHVEEYTFLK